MPLKSLSIVGANHYQDIKETFNKNLISNKLNISF